MSAHEYDVLEGCEVEERTALVPVCLGGNALRAVIGCNNFHYCSQRMQRNFSKEGAHKHLDDSEIVIVGLGNKVVDVLVDGTPI